MNAQVSPLISKEPASLSMATPQLDVLTASLMFDEVTGRVRFYCDGRFS